MPGVRIIQIRRCRRGVGLDVARRNSSSDSIVVLLDWFPGHFTDEVAAKIKSKGHVLLLHGGGSKLFAQVNDTHLHALLQVSLVRLEVVWAADERQRLEALTQSFRVGAQPQV